MAKNRVPRKSIEPLGPSDLLHFVELDEFGDDWRRLGLDVEHDLWDLQAALMFDPTAGDMVQGTGGLRKLRFAPAGWQLGKRGAVRVCYAYWERHALILLVMAYAKNRKESLSEQEKAGIRAYLGRCERWLDRRRR